MGFEVWDQAAADSHLQRAQRCEVLRFVPAWLTVSLLLTTEHIIELSKLKYAKHTVKALLKYW